MTQIGNRQQFDPLPGGGYVLHLIDEALRIELRYLRRKDQQLHAEVDVRCDWAGVRTHRGSLACADMNLSSLSARKLLALHCRERALTRPDDPFDWIGAIHAACLLTIQAERHGDDVIILDDAPDVAARDLDVYGLTIPADARSMFVAHGDSLKSLLLLLVLGTFAQSGRRVLLLDWEWSGDRHRARKVRLFGADRLDTLRYLRCNAPLTIEADRIRRYCETHQIAFVGGDSIGMACDGKLADDDVAIRFHRAAATLPPSLWAAHVPKSAVAADVKTDPQAFGSVYFSNLCRASWVVKKQPGATENVVTVGLFPQKQNDGSRSKPVGLEFTFADAQIAASRVDLATVEGLSDRLPLATRMIYALKRGPLSYAELATALDAKVDSVIQAARRSNAFTKIVDTPDGIHRIALAETRFQDG